MAWNGAYQTAYFTRRARRALLRGCDHRLVGGAYALRAAHIFTLRALPPLFILFSAPRLPA